MAIWGPWINGPTITMGYNPVTNTPIYPTELTTPGRPQHPFENHAGLISHGAPSWSSSSRYNYWPWNEVAFDECLKDHSQNNHAFRADDYSSTVAPGTFSGWYPALGCPTPTMNQWYRTSAADSYGGGSVGWLAQFRDDGYEPPLVQDSMVQSYTYAAGSLYFLMPTDYAVSEWLNYGVTGLGAYAVDVQFEGATDTYQTSLGVGGMVANTQFTASSVDIHLTHDPANAQTRTSHIQIWAKWGSAVGNTNWEWPTIDSPDLASWTYVTTVVVSALTDIDITLDVSGVPGVAGANALRIALYPDNDFTVPHSGISTESTMWGWTQSWGTITMTLPRYRAMTLEAASGPLEDALQLSTDGGRIFTYRTGSGTLLDDQVSNFNGTDPVLGWPMHPTDWWNADYWSYGRNVVGGSDGRIWMYSLALDPVYPSVSGRTQRVDYYMPVDVATDGTITQGAFRQFSFPTNPIGSTGSKNWDAIFTLENGADFIATWRTSAATTSWGVYAVSTATGIPRLLTAVNAPVYPTAWPYDWDLICAGKQHAGFASFYNSHGGSVVAQDQVIFVVGEVSGSTATYGPEFKITDLDGDTFMGRADVVGTKMVFYLQRWGSSPDYINSLYFVCYDLVSHTWGTPVTIPDVTVSGGNWAGIGQEAQESGIYLSAIGDWYLMAERPMIESNLVDSYVRVVAFPVNPMGGSPGSPIMSVETADYPFSDLPVLTSERGRTGNDGVYGIGLDEGDVFLATFQPGAFRRISTVRTWANTSFALYTGGPSTGPLSFLYTARMKQLTADYQAGP